MTTGPKILFLDIETAPLLSYTWGLWDQNVALNQIHKDWHLLSWSARWASDPAGKTMYMDQRGVKNIEDDKKILKEVWKLLDEADIVVTQNGVSFDQKKLNARFVLQGMKPPSTYRSIDTLILAKKHFAFTSNKLEYMSEKLNKKYKKLKHEKFSGFELWKECLKNNKKAWQEMEKYNRHDVLALEELYQTLVVWDNTITFSVYSDSTDLLCSCGGTSMQKRGYAYTNTSKFQIYQCKDCGKYHRGRTNLLSSAKRKSLRST